MVEIPSLKLPAGWIAGTVGAGDAFCAAWKELGIKAAIELGTARHVLCRNLAERKACVLWKRQWNCTQECVKKRIKGLHRVAACEGLLFRNESL